ncbi:hypothetical protein CONLIGDRAFT_650113 [Coniochaeta ligniaria NRRL 30616]|uniref:Uncharacterized protein n=1 Tax=Coniochaeta ligniaria NRRL 30616 TaxID=1408157 RepID=A0A1J7I5U0_9PEZI|nr:hypothetical protein CONLIGDRAFT_650113 [Coniochaeta ligniaria NRRL 30616]
MSSTKQPLKGGTGYGTRYSQEQIDFVVNAEGKYKQVAEEFKATFAQEIKPKGVRYLKAKHAPLRTHYKWSPEQVTFVVNAAGTTKEDINERSIKHLKLRYGPGAPLPNKDTKGKWTREQVQFVLAECDRPDYEYMAERVLFAQIAENYNTQFAPATKINARGIRTIREQYGPAFVLPGNYTNEQLQFIRETEGTHQEVAKAYNARFNPRTKMGVTVVTHLKEQYGGGPASRSSSSHPQTGTTSGGNDDQEESNSRLDSDDSPSAYGGACSGQPQPEQAFNDNHFLVTKAPTHPTQATRLTTPDCNPPARPAVTLSPISQLLAAADEDYSQYTAGNTAYGQADPWYPELHDTYHVEGYQQDPGSQRGFQQDQCQQGLHQQDQDQQGLCQQDLYQQDQYWQDQYQ